MQRDKSYEMNEINEKKIKYNEEMYAYKMK